MSLRYRLLGIPKTVDDFIDMGTFKRYYHENHSIMDMFEYGCHGTMIRAIELPITVGEKVVPYENSEVLVVQKAAGNIESTIVIGKIIEYKKKIKNTKVSIVRPVTAEDKAPLEKIVQELGFKGNVSFW